VLHLDSVPLDDLSIDEDTLQLGWALLLLNGLKSGAAADGIVHQCERLVLLHRCACLPVTRSTEAVKKSETRVHTRHRVGQRGGSDEMSHTRHRVRQSETRVMRWLWSHRHQVNTPEAVLGQEVPLGHKYHDDL